MDKYIMVGADVHDKSMLLKIAEGKQVYLTWKASAVHVFSDAMGR